MTWTYTNLPSTVTRDAVRMLAGDTSSANQLVTDEEIAYFTATYSNNYMAAAEVCDAIAAKLSYQVDTNNEGLSVSASQRAKAFTERAKDLRKKSNRSVSIWVGGRSESERETAEEDTANKQPNFSLGMYDLETPSTTST